jgi:hypothetical protein
MRCTHRTPKTGNGEVATKILHTLVEYVRAWPCTVHIMLLDQWGILQKSEKCYGTHVASFTGSGSFEGTYATDSLRNDAREHGCV